MSSVGAPPRDRPQASVMAAADASALLTDMALTLSLLVGGFALLSAAVVVLLGLSHSAEWALYILSVVVLAPVAFLGGQRLAAALESRVGPVATATLAARGAAGLLAILLISRVAYSAGVSSSAVLLLLVPVWAVGVALCARRNARTESASRAWTAAAALGVMCFLAFISPELHRPLRLGGSLAIAAVLAALHLRLRGSSTPRWVGPVLDASAATVVILAVTDVGGYLEYLRPGAKTFLIDGTSLAPGLLAFLHRIHAGFWLGPLNDMLHGRALLVDTSSQYGVGVFYFLAAFFQIAPLGYGALALLAGFFTALQYALVYGVMRVGGAARTLAIPAIGAAIVGLVFGSIGSPADFPNTGALRYGIPWLLVALAVLWARWPRHRRQLQMMAAALVGISSVWSVETFVYASATFGGAAAFEAASGQVGRRLRALMRDVLAAASCCAVAYLLLAVGTRAFAGSWPDWSTYLAFLKVYSGSGLYTLLVAAWSPALPLLLLHLASGLSLAAMVARRRELVLECRPALVAIAACSALGIASFSYYVGNSHHINLQFSDGLPAIVEACLWVSLVSERLPSAPRAVRLGVVAAGFWMAALVGIPGWPGATAKFRRTALAHIIPDGSRGGSIQTAVSRLWRSPPSDPRALVAEGLLDRYLPPGAPVLAIVEPELTLETLVRSGRVNVLPISDPEQDNIAPDQADPRVGRAIDHLQPGTLVLGEPAAFDAPVKPPAALIPGQLVRLQKLAIDRIRARFRLEVVDRGDAGLAIFRLSARR